MGLKKIDLLDLPFDRLKDYLREQGEPASHAGTIFRCIYRGLTGAFPEMAGLPSSLRQKLAENAVLSTLHPLAEIASSDGQTRKTLFQLDDGRTVESALMHYGKSSGPGILYHPDSGKITAERKTSPAVRQPRERRTVCVSTQVGCPVGCAFCATGRQGFERNLRPGEIVEQVLYYLRSRCDSLPGQEESPVKPSVINVVFMGMGEPLANYDSVRQAVAILQSPQGLGLGIRQITLSTAGLVPQIRRLIADDLRLELAVSLHAADDDLRSRLVPINKKYPLSDLMEACREYSAKTGRRIFIEYAAFDGINDAPADAGSLVRLLEGLPCSVNLIVGNPGPSGEYRPAPLERVLAFQKKLIESGFRCMVRVSKGTDIEAGCGQLRSRLAAASPK